MYHLNMRTKHPQPKRPTFLFILQIRVTFITNYKKHIKSIPFKKRYEIGLFCQFLYLD